MSKAMNLTNYCKAGFPLIVIKTDEIKRAVNSIHADEGFSVYRWNIQDGIFCNRQELNGQKKTLQEIVQFSGTIEKSILVLENFAWFTEEKQLKQAILNLLEVYKNNNTCLVFVGQEKPDSFFDKIAHYLEFSLPGKEDFLPMIQDLAEGLGQDISESEMDNIAANCLGLTLEEAENCLALSIVENGKIDVSSIYHAKEAIINASGFMTLQKPEDITAIGGLEPVKKYARARLKAYEPGNEHLPKLRQIVLVGVPGTGKTLFAKSLASMLGYLFVSANMGNMKNSLVGETEKATKRFTETVDCLGNVVVLLDEAEKMFSFGVNDGGTSNNQNGQFLTWTNDRKSNAILVLTTNNLSAFPAEFLRAGRNDVIFFVDYPTLTERRAIIEIMNKKHGSSLPVSLAERLENWSGAEIEQLAKDSFFDEIPFLVETMPTLWRTDRAKIEDIQARAKNYRKANSEETLTVEIGKKKRSLLQ